MSKNKKLEKKRFEMTDNGSSIHPSRMTRIDEPSSSSSLPSSSSSSSASPSSLDSTRKRRSRWDVAQTNTSPSGNNLEAATIVEVEDDPDSDEESFKGRGKSGVAPFTDAELDAMLPSQDYTIVQEPAGYASSARAARLATVGSSLFGESGSSAAAAAAAAGLKSEMLKQTPAHLPDLKAGDQSFFASLLMGADKETEEAGKERSLLELLLMIKNGSSVQRKLALRRVTDRAQHFGASLLFKKILPILMAPALEEQERHLMIKVIDRVLYKLGPLVQPFVKDVMTVVEPLLLDEDNVVRQEGREIIANLAKAAGLRSMIETLRPSLDNVDEVVRSATSRAFAIVGRTLGVQLLVPFIAAVCSSTRSWHARHTGCKIIQHLAILSGPAILSHLPLLVAALKPCLTDQQPTVRTVAALAISALAEAASPYGIE